MDKNDYILKSINRKLTVIGVAAAFCVYFAYRNSIINKKGENKMK